MKKNSIINASSVIIRYLQGKNSPNKTPFISNGKTKLLQQQSDPQTPLLEAFRKHTITIIHQGIADATVGKSVEDGLHAIDQQAVKTSSELTQLLSNQRKRTEREIVDMKQLQQEIRTEDDYLKELEGKKLEETEKAERTIRASKVNNELKSLVGKRGTVEGVKEGLEEELRQKGEKYEQLDMRYKHMLLNRYQHMPPVRTWIHNILFFGPTVLLLILLEVELNFTSFQIASFGDSNFIAMSLALFFAIGQAWGAKQFGSKLLKKHQADKYGNAEGSPLTKSREKRYNQVLSLFGGLTVLICLLMGAFRLGLEDPDAIKAVYVVINFIIAVVTAIFAYYHAKDQDFFDIEKRRSDVANRLNLKRSQLARIEKELQQNIERIDWNIKEEARKLAISEKKHCQKHINQLETELDLMTNQEKQWQAQLKHLTEKAKTDYQKQYEQGNKGRVISTDKFSKNGHANLGKIIPLLLLMALGNMGCVQQKPETHIEVLYDQTEIVAQPNVDEMVDFILKTSGVQLQRGHWGKTTVNISTIGEISTQKVQQVILPKSEPYWSRNEREHKIKPEEFRKDLVKAIDAVTQSGKGTSYSYIHRNYYYRLKELAQKPGNRFVFSWCDLIINNPPLNFPNYRDNPKMLLEHQDSFITVMTHHYPLGQMKDVQLVNIHQSNRLNDALHENCKRYFEHYWQDQLGMEVTFLTNIPNQTMATAKTADK